MPGKPLVFVFHGFIAPPSVGWLMVMRRRWLGRAARGRGRQMRRRAVLVRNAGHGESLGGVLGDVVRYGRGAERLPGSGQVVAVADGPGVGALRRAEGEPDGGDSRAGAGSEGDGGGRLTDRVAQHGGGVASGWWLVVVAGGVQADNGVEVDNAAYLVFGDLDETEPAGRTSPQASTAKAQNANDQDCAEPPARKSGLRVPGDGHRRAHSPAGTIYRASSARLSCSATLGSGLKPGISGFGNLM